MIMANNNIIHRINFAVRQWDKAFLDIQDVQMLAGSSEKASTDKLVSEI